METEATRQQNALRQFVASGQYLHRTYGLEWGDPRLVPELSEVLHRFLLPYATPEATVVEIGAGGGRWSREINGRAGWLILVDGAPEFEKAIRRHLDCSEVLFLVSPDGALPQLPSNRVDLVFSFDTFVHFDRPLFDRYVETVGRILRPGGRFVLHHACRYPECPSDPQCFQYREEAEVDALLHRHQMHPLQSVAFRCGLGSRLVLARKSAAN
jgi:SAM-dependent methyltransferase